MKTEILSIKGPILFTPKQHEDERGYFMENFRAADFEAATGVKAAFVQDNLSMSRKAGTLRGLHIQTPPHSQGKLVSCQRGRITDVIVDVRKNSRTFGHHITVELSAKTHAQLWVPPAFLHGYVTREDNCEVYYKVTDYYAPKYESTILWNDIDLGIDWSVNSPIISGRDQSALPFAQFESPYK
jgi:dTDP-4-dehydrorhamnose 3,5-epimerase